MRNTDLADKPDQHGFVLDMSLPGFSTVRIDCVFSCGKIEGFGPNKKIREYLSNPFNPDSKKSRAKIPGLDSVDDYGGMMA